LLKGKKASQREYFLPVSPVFSASLLESRNWQAGILNNGKCKKEKMQKNGNISSFQNAVGSRRFGGLAGLQHHWAKRGKEAAGEDTMLWTMTLPVATGCLTAGGHVWFACTNDESFISRIRPTRVQDQPVYAAVVPDAADPRNPNLVYADIISPTDPISPPAGHSSGVSVCKERIRLVSFPAVPKASPSQ